MNESLAAEIRSSGVKAAYDEHAKRLLAHKIILAHILVSAVKEFSGMDPEAVVPLIEGTPEISSMAVDPGLSNNPMITGERNEDKIPYEGMITYDIRFHAWVPGKEEMVKIILDVEAQQKFKPSPGYDISTRAVYYGARMLSAQQGTEFTTNYADIKKVYSIWICMNAPAQVANTITGISLDKQAICGASVDVGRYDLLGVIIVALSKHLVKDGDDELRLHRLLGAIFSPDLTVSNKKVILSDEFEIQLTTEMERSFDHMCNLSEAIEEKGEIKALNKLVKNGTISIEQAALNTGLTVDQFLEKVKEFGLE